MALLRRGKKATNVDVLLLFARVRLSRVLVRSSESKKHSGETLPFDLISYSKSNVLSNTAPC